MRIILCWGQRGGDALEGFFVYSWLFTAQAGSRSDGFYKLDDARRWRRVLSETIDATKVPNRVCKQVLLLFYSGEVMFRLSCRPQKEGLFGDKIIIHFWLKGEEIAINILQTQSSNHLYFSISAKWNLTSIDCVVRTVLSTVTSLTLSGILDTEAYCSITLPSWSQTMAIRALWVIYSQSLSSPDKNNI